MYISLACNMIDIISGECYYNWLPHRSGSPLFIECSTIEARVIVVSLQCGCGVQTITYLCLWLATKQIDCGGWQVVIALSVLCILPHLDQILKHRVQLWFIPFCWCLDHKPNCYRIIYATLLFLGLVLLLVSTRALLGSRSNLGFLYSLVVLPLATPFILQLLSCPLHYTTSFIIVTSVQSWKIVCNLVIRNINQLSQPYTFPKI